jgi:hypothetical protein
MTSAERQIAAIVPTTLLATVVLLCASAPASAAGTQTVSPLPESDYSVHHVCPTPALGRAACLALRLVPLTAAARAYSHPLAISRSVGAGVSVCTPPKADEGCFGLDPGEVHSVYDLPSKSESSKAQTIALIDAYNDPTAEADLETYDQTFGLGECTSTPVNKSKCFTQVNERGEEGNLPRPKTPAELNSMRTSEPEEAEEAEGWTVEMSLDIETVRATCKNCKVLLVEAGSTDDSSLEIAERTAERLGATEISNSWGGPECVVEGFVRECVDELPGFEGGRTFNDPGTVITVAAGDDGYLDWDTSPSGFTDYPASSPYVVAVGGTRLSKLGVGGTWTGETVWNGYGATGGGCSVEFEAQPWQQSASDWSSVGCASHRAVADVSADADPYTGFAVYDSSSEECKPEHEAVHWCPIGGTSLASPLIASVFALAGGANGVSYPARTLYENERYTPSALHDVSSGSNGKCTLGYNLETGLSECETAEEAANCSGQLICVAAPCYDGPTGVGTPDGIAAFRPPAGTKEEACVPKPTVTTSTDTASSTPPPTPSPAPMTTTPTPLVVAPLAERLSGLGLTIKALLALDRSHPRVAEIAYTFTSALAAHVAASLEKLSVKHGRAHWHAIGHPVSFMARGGHNSHRMAGRQALSAGAYRLTLTPASGAAVSISFRIG